MATVPSQLATTVLRWKLFLEWFNCILYVIILLTLKFKKLRMHFMILEKTEDSTMVAILLQAAAATVEVYLWEKWTRTVSRWRPPSNSASCRLYGCLIFSILLNLMFPLLFCMVHCTVCILYKVYAVPDDPTLRFLNVPKNKTRKTTLLLSN